MSIFKKGNKNPVEIMKSLKSCLNVLELQPAGKKLDKAVEDLTKNLLAMKVVMCGTEQHEPQSELVAQLSQEFYNSDILEDIVKNLSLVDFEGKKDFTQTFGILIRRQIGSRNPTVEYLMSKYCFVQRLINSYENPAIALTCGVLLRECIRYELLADMVLKNEDFFKFFDYVEMSTFDISSDAFTTFKDLMTRHKLLCATFLNKEYDRVFLSYSQLLASENYVTRRQSLKLLGELLLDRHNYTIMTRYISKPENLKIMMNNLRDQSRNIQFEAFHVFKVFVANPNKTKPILDILLKNQQKLVDFLSNFHTDRSDDEQFNDEKAYLIKQVMTDLNAVSALFQQLDYTALKYLTNITQIKELKS